MRKLEKRLARAADYVERYYCAECLPADCKCSDTYESYRPNYNIHYNSTAQRSDVKSYRRS